MTEMMGEVLIANLRKIRSNLPVILCTGYSSKRDDGRAAELGVKALLMKPLSRTG